MKRLLSIVLLTGCAWAPPVQPTPTPRDTDASCADACKNLQRLGCPEGEPTEAGDSCEVVCENARSTPSPLPTSCVAQLQSCEQISGC